MLKIYRWHNLDIITEEGNRERETANRIDGNFNYAKVLIFLAVLVSVFLGFSVEGKSPKAMADTCVAGSSCGSQPVRFVPGQRITVEVANFTSGIVEIQQLYTTDPLPISPGQVLSFVRGASTDPNFSVVFWDSQGLPLKVNILKPEARILRIEVRPGTRPPGDRAVYLKDDGRIQVL